jgi:hypothetical protein
MHLRLEERDVVSGDDLIVAVVVTVLATYLATKLLGAVPWLARFHRRSTTSAPSEVPDRPALENRAVPSGVLTRDGRLRRPRVRLQPRIQSNRRPPRR